MPIYVNTYKVHRRFGGPEEGGWWYDQGWAEDSVVVVDEEKAQEYAAELQKIHPPDLNRRRFSAAGGTDTVIRIEDELARDFPEHRPHYE